MNNATPMHMHGTGDNLLSNVNGDNSQVVDAIHGAFKNGYFSRIYTLRNPSIYTIIMLLTIYFKV